MLNRAGLGACAAAMGGAHSEPNLSAEEKKKAAAHLRKHYRAIKEDAPEGIKESKLQRGKPLEELVKGSMDYTRQLIDDAFRLQFPYQEGGVNYWMVEPFDGYITVKAWNSRELKADEYWKVTYTRSGEAYTFAARDQWEVVELAYQPQTAITESRKKNGKRIEERIEPAQVHLLEAKDEAGKTRRIRINDLMVADEANGNKRLYKREVIEAMVADWQPYLRESRGQGRLMILTGEVEHPSDKGKKRPEYLETVVRWDTLDWDGKRLNIEGDLILTSKGRDVEILMEAGVNPGGSIRGIGESRIEKVNGEKVEIVEWVSMNAADLVGDPSFLNAAELQESQNQSSEDEMDIEQLKALIESNPDLFKNLIGKDLAALSEVQVKKIEKQVREALGLDETANIAEALKATADKARKFDESAKQAEVEAAITEATKDLPFGDKLNKQFAEALKASGAKDAAGVKVIAEAKRKEYGAIAAALKLSGMGFTGKPNLHVIGDVLETETGTPEFARATFQLLESVQRFEKRTKSSLKEHEESPAAVYTQMLLERFDKLHMRELMQESKLLQEAELVSDLNLPYSVSRAIIEEAFPNLISANIFDVGVMEHSPDRMYYEVTTGETGYSATITDEVVTGGAEAVWYALAHGRVTPATVTVTSNPAGTTYVEGTDYVIDYAAGRIKFLAAGSINTNDVLVDYTYTAIRQGEMAPIERVKTSLTYKTIEAAADRIADQISREAFIFSQSQLGWDAIARTMANLIRQLQRKIDQGMLYAAYSAVLSVAANSTDTWTIGTAQADYATLYRLLGEAAVIVAKRFYNPTFYLASVTNADRLSNWEGFKRDGFPQALLNAAGFVGMVKNRPVFSSTEFPDSLWIAGNRELVQHRVFQPTIIKGPYPSYDVSGGTTKIVAAEQYYAEQFDATESPVPEKGAYVPVAAAAS